MSVEAYARCCRDHRDLDAGGQDAHEDGNDATGLRSDPLFKMALGRVPSERDLC